MIKETVKLRGNGHSNVITIAPEIQKKLGLVLGDEVLVVVDDNGVCTIRKKTDVDLYNDLV